MLKKEQTSIRETAMQRAGGAGCNVTRFRRMFGAVIIRKYENDAFCIFPLGKSSKRESLANLNVSRKVRNGFLIVGASAVNSAH